MTTGAASPLGVWHRHASNDAFDSAGTIDHHQLTTTFDALSFNHSYVVITAAGIFLVRIEHSSEFGLNRREGSGL
jgi:hypothetical protein